MIRRPTMPTLPNVALAALAVGCATSEGGGAEILVPDLVAVEWDTSYNQRGDGLGALVPLDVMVYDGASGRPVPDVSVTLFVDDDEAVTAVPVGAAYFSLPGSQPGEFSLPGSRPGEFQDVADDEVLWDSRHDQYLTLRPPSDTEGGRAVQLTTDGWGLARWYLFVDAFPRSGAGFDPIPLTVSNGADETFLLTPQ